MSRSQRLLPNSITEFLRNHRTSSRDRRSLVNGSTFVPPPPTPHITHSPAAVTMPSSSRHRRQSTATTTSSSTDPSSVFDATPWSDSDYSSSYSPSVCTDAMTIPSLDGTIPPAHNSLPCEFVGYASCDRYFHPLEVSRWMEHIIVDHLGNQVPSKSACWYCDNCDFDASRDGVDKMTLFRNRLEHISIHITDGGYGVEHIRPDYAFIAHLKKSGLINQSVFETTQAWQEGPVSGVQDIFPHDWVPPERQSHYGQSQSVVIESSRGRRSNRHSDDRKGRRRQHGTKHG